MPPPRTLSGTSSGSDETFSTHYQREVTPGKRWLLEGKCSAFLASGREPTVYTTHEPTTVLAHAHFDVKCACVSDMLSIQTQL